jgi:hypothetical protein
MEPELDAWERERLEELRQLRERWRKRARALLEEARAARASGSKDGIAHAVELERYVEMINTLFDNAEAKLYAAARARIRGEAWNEAIAEEEAATDLAMLRSYAREWP